MPGGVNDPVEGFSRTDGSARIICAVTVTDAATPARRTTATAGTIIFVFFFDFFSEPHRFLHLFFHLHLIFVSGSVFLCTADSIIAHYQMSLYRFLLLVLLAFLVTAR